MKIGLRWLVEVSWVSLVPPLDSGFRRNDELGGDSTGATYFRANRSCRMAPAHQGMKIEVLTGGGVCGSFATHTPPLDSRFRGNDELGGRNDEAGAGGIQAYFEAA